MILESGNAYAAGAASRGWMVGDIASWAASRGETTTTLVTPRQSSQVEVKWYQHPPGDERAAWAVDARYTTLTIIIDGELHLAFRSDESGDVTPVHLARRGDYAIWEGADCSHTWHSPNGCLLVTVRWPRLHLDTQ